MKTPYDHKQLSDSPQGADRVRHLRAWMVLNGITFSALGEKLGISNSGAQLLLKGERMAVARHKECLALGVPEELLPRPEDVPMGRPRVELPETEVQFP